MAMVQVERVHTADQYGNIQWRGRSLWMWNKTHIYV